MPTLQSHPETDCSTGREEEHIMLAALAAICGILGLGSMFLILRNYRRQADIKEGPGIVPEDYD
jgi:hypothetical protein